MQNEDVMTFSEIEKNLGRDPISSRFPTELEYLGVILGHAVNNENMIELNKLLIESQLLAFKSLKPEAFTREMSNKLTVKVGLGMARPNDKNFNDLLAHLIREYTNLVAQA